MNNERYNQIIDEVYENYKHYFENKYGNYITGRITKEDGDYLIVNKHPLPQETILSIIYSKEEFINKCKNDSEFSERWGLKIEERELSQRERVKLLQEAWKNNGIMPEHEEVTTLWVEYNNLMTKYNIPTKLITVTYQENKIEIYE